MIQHIVVGVDFSEGSRAALLEGEQLAEQFDVACLAVHVLPSLIPAFPEALPVPMDPAWQEKEERESMEHLQEWITPLPKASGKILTGEAAHQLVCTADQDALLVMGHEHHSALASLLFGSTTRWVLDHAPCPVLVVPKPTRPGAKASEH
ncbi:MAG: universal stress protein [Holophagaceae bacterium]